MKQIIFSIALVASIMSTETSFSQDPTQEEVRESRAEYYQVWCKRVDSILRVALRRSIEGATYEDEKKILLKAVQETLNIASPKKNFYFINTLKLIPVGLENYHTVEEQVFFLREETRNALQDLKYLDTHFWRGNHRHYVIKLIDRGLEEGLRAKTDEQETFALDKASNAAITLLDDSTYRRNYACARWELEHALNSEDILMKRDHMRIAYGILKSAHGCFSSM